MALGIREGEGLGCFGNQADQTFTREHCGQMHSFAIETFGSKKFEPTIRAQHIERAHFSHHIGGDRDHDFIETSLSVDGLGHDLAQPA
jgi:hypothetical protein